MARYLIKILKAHLSDLFLERGKLSPVHLRQWGYANLIGWDIGMAGMQVGGERKLQVPAAAAYGSKKLPDIPPNSDLIFDVKCVGVN
jgi:FKBP-type peptidyl-prolyl cis-trans isomerase